MKRERRGPQLVFKGKWELIWFRGWKGIPLEGTA